MRHWFSVTEHTGLENNMNMLVVTYRGWLELSDLCLIPHRFLIM